MNKEEEQRIKEILSEPIKKIRRKLKDSIETTPSHLRGVLIDDYDFDMIMNEIYNYLEFTVEKAISHIWASLFRFHFKEEDN